MQQRRKLGRIITIGTVTITIIFLITPGARKLGAGGSCAGRSEAIRVLRLISHGHGPITDPARVAPRSVPSWCGAITSGKLWATKTVNGSVKVAMRGAPYGPGPAPSQAQSLSGAPKSEKAGPSPRLVRLILPRRFRLVAWLMWGGWQHASYARRMTSSFERPSRGTRQTSHMLGYLLSFCQVFGVREPHPAFGNTHQTLRLVFVRFVPRLAAT